MKEPRRIITLSKAQAELIKRLREKNTRLVKNLAYDWFSFESGSGTINTRTAKALLGFRNLIKLSEGEICKYELTEEGKAIEL